MQGNGIRLGLFTDTFDEINGVARFLRDMGERAADCGRTLIIHTCSGGRRFDLPYRKNFDPLLSRPWPYYPELQLNLPPMPEIVAWAERTRFDVVHVSTPGPMGLCGWLVAKVLKVPLLGTYHTDYPAYADHLAHVPIITGGTTTYMKWFHGQMAGVFSRSGAYESKLSGLGIAAERMLRIRPAINTDKFDPGHRDPGLWERLGVKQPHRLFYCGRVSVEKNLPFLVEIFQRLCRRRRDTALIVAGDGPYLNEMRQQLADVPVRFLGYQDDTQLPALYAGSDLFVFPSRTDTLGQVVMEAQACGLPVVISDEGGPREVTEDGVTGMILAAADAGRWVEAIEQLLNDDGLRRRMSAAGPQRISRLSLENTFDDFWSEHVEAVRAAAKAGAAKTAHPRPMPAPMMARARQ